MKSKLNLCIFLILLLFTISAVSAGDNQTDVLADDSYHNYTQLNQDISTSGDTFDVQYNYKYQSNETSQIMINADNLTINGNNHIIDGSQKAGVFKFIFYNDNNNVIINDITFKNCRDYLLACMGGKLTLNNVTFVDNNAGGIILTSESDITINSCTFKFNSVNNIAESSSNSKNTVIVNNSEFVGNDCNISGIIANRVTMIVENSTFMNSNASYGAAIEYRGGALSVKKSKFMHLNAMTGGAILGKFLPKTNDGIYFPDDAITIADCLFEDVTSSHNGGAVMFDLDSRAENITKTLNILNCSFTNCGSNFGGAVLNVGGIMNITDSTFKGNNAAHKGGAFYTVLCNLSLNNVTLEDNSAKSAGGVIYFDNGTLTIIDSNLTNNSAEDIAAAIYANEISAVFKNSVFDNNKKSVYAVFTKYHEDDSDSDDEFSWDNTVYVVSVENEAIKLNLTNDTSDLSDIPSKYDLREKGWVTSIKDQKYVNTCWAFATMAAIESSLLKSTGITYDLSEENYKDLQMRYFELGDMRNPEIGFMYSSLGYTLSWFGPITEDEEIYDERSLVSDLSNSKNRIHVQDAIIIFGGRNDTSTLLKQAIMKYGGVCIQFEPDIFGQFNGKFCNNFTAYPDHFVTLIGWDDEYNASNFGDRASNPGAWIIKNSWGEIDGNDGYGYISYDDKTFMAIDDHHSIVPQWAAVAFIFENDIDYHVNYQSDLTGLTGFDEDYTVYSNEFTSKYSELIGAVGTYFNESGINYSFDVYVNGAKVHSQSGVSEFAGFRTIVLNRYIPVKANDTFKVVFKSNALPYQAYSRMHYIQGMSMVSADAKTFEDITLENKTVCLKVYTVADDTKIINNKNIAVDYTGGKYFSVKVVTSDGKAIGAGSVVKFTINGKTTSVKTNSKGIAKIKITQLPKKYTIKTTYNGKTYKNTVTVKQVLTASKITVKKKTAKKLVLKAKLKINGKLVKGKVIKFKFKGKTYKVKTNKKGIAQKILKKNVIKKLKKGKTYYLKIIYLKTFIKTTVKLK